MSSLIIEIKINQDQVDNMFKTLIDNSKGITKAQFQIYKRIYMVKMMSMFNSMKGTILRKAKKIEGMEVLESSKDYIKSRQTDSKEQIDIITKKWEDFMMSDEKSLAKESDGIYQSIQNDRIFKRTISKIKGVKDKLTDKGIKMALNGNTVFDFFNTLSINIIWHRWLD